MEFTNDELRIILNLLKIRVAMLDEGTTPNAEKELDIVRGLYRKFKLYQVAWL